MLLQLNSLKLCLCPFPGLNRRLGCFLLEAVIFRICFHLYLNLALQNKLKSPPLFLGKDGKLVNGDLCTSDFLSQGGSLSVKVVVCFSWFGEGHYICECQFFICTI